MPSGVTAAIVVGVGSLALLLGNKVKNMLAKSDDDSDRDLLIELKNNLVDITGESSENIQLFLDSIEHNKNVDVKQSNVVELNKLIQIKILFKKLDVNTIDRKVVIVWVDNNILKTRTISMKTDFDNIDSNIRKQFIKDSINELEFIFYDKQN